MTRPALSLVPAQPSSRFEDVVLPLRAELVGSAMRLAGSRAEADDLVQEAILRAWSFWDRFEAGTNARAWMHRILVNTFINGYRRRRREREILAAVLLVEEQLRTPGSEARPHGVGDEVQAALATLPDDFRAVLLRVDLGEDSYQEAADALGCPVGTVMSRLHRARKAMQRALREYAVSEGYVAAA